MSEQEDFRIKKAIAKFAKRISEAFKKYPTFTIEEINEDPAETLLSPEDFASVFEDEANEMLKKIDKEKGVTPNG